jgi:hypothetical protein
MTDKPTPEGINSMNTKLNGWVSFLDGMPIEGDVYFTISENSYLGHRHELHPLQYIIDEQEGRCDIRVVCSGPAYKVLPEGVLYDPHKTCPFRRLLFWHPGILVPEGFEHLTGVTGVLRYSC